MLEQLVGDCACEACDRPLTEERRMLTMETSGGIRHAYECDCGAVTITLARD